MEKKLHDFFFFLYGTDSLFKFLEDLGIEEDSDSEFGDFRKTITVLYPKQLYLKRVKYTEEAATEAK